MSGIVGRLQETPGDPALREVVLDHWLEQTDPRAAWGAALRRGVGAEEAFDALVAALPGPPHRRVRGIEGFVVEVAWSLEAFLDAPAPSSRLAEHPLAIAHVRLPTITERTTAGAMTWAEFQRAFTALVLTCGPVRGVVFEGVQPDHVATVVGWVDELSPRVLGLELADPERIAVPDARWPSVRDVLLGEIRSEDLASWLRLVPRADRLALRGDRRTARTLIDAWLTVDRPWRAADLRGCSPLVEERRRTFMDRRAKTWIRHEDAERRGLDPLDDPFGDRGSSRPRPARTARCAAVDEGTSVRPTRWVQSEGEQIRWHRDDAPEDALLAPAPVTALIGEGGGVVWGDATGALRRHTFGDGEPWHELGQVPGSVRGLARYGDRLAFWTSEGWGTLAGDQIAFEPDPVVGVAWRADGPLVARGSVVQTPSGQIDLGDPITALVTIVDDAFVIAGGWLYQGCGERWSVRRRLERGASRLSTGPFSLAYIDGGQQVRGWL
ncbi:MAG: hypothetical protein AAF602_08530, partial [Myxococcota bacterium]